MSGCLGSTPSAFRAPRHARPSPGASAARAAHFLRTRAMASTSPSPGSSERRNATSFSQCPETVGSPRRLASIPRRWPRFGERCARLHSGRCSNDGSSSATWPTLMERDEVAELGPNDWHPVISRVSGLRRVLRRRAHGCRALPKRSDARQQARRSLASETPPAPARAGRSRGPRTSRQRIETGRTRRQTPGAEPRIRTRKARP